MGDKISEIIKKIDLLSPDERKNLLRKLNGKKKYDKNYPKIIKKVKEHLELNGSITTKEAFELGFLKKELQITHFRRCVISKIDLEIGEKRLSNRRVTFYLLGKGEPIEFLKVDTKLAKEIIKDINLNNKHHDLYPLLDNKKYPILKKPESLMLLRNILVKEMHKHGYEVVGPRLRFKRDD